ncbi:MAG: hypothetical protein JSW71_06640 [Gemmatimonadota bacterium]|nr:MAG: hypothetical protein JSW71_06640 [Gemmatimonadota bacterium]
MGYVISVEDTWYAKRLPDDFIGRSGDAFSRITQIVNENWWQHEGVALTRLVEALLPVLEPLENGGERVLDKYRGKCVDVVEKWLAGQ